MFEIFFLPDKKTRFREKQRNFLPTRSKNTFCNFFNVSIANRCSSFSSSLFPVPVDSNFNHDRGRRITSVERTNNYLFPHHPDHDSSRRRSGGTSRWLNYASIVLSEWVTNMINYNSLRKTTCGVVHTMKSGKEEREREREKYRRIITTLGSAKFFSLGSTRNPRNR